MYSESLANFRHCPLKIMLPTSDKNWNITPLCIGYIMYDFSTVKRKCDRLHKLLLIQKYLPGIYFLKIRMNFSSLFKGYESEDLICLWCFKNSFLFRKNMNLITIWRFLLSFIHFILSFIHFDLSFIHFDTNQIWFKV